LFAQVAVQLLRIAVERLFAVAIRATEQKWFWKTYVALAVDGVQVVGYVTLSAGHVKTQRLPSSRAFSSAVESNVSMRGAARCSWERLAGFEGTRVAFQTKRLRK
jgi:hypothetical protein